MKTKERKNGKEPNELSAAQSETKKISAAGKWLNDTHAAPFMRIIDMRAVLK
jgi:hypothetical protein